MLPPRLQTLLQSELQPGERVLWAGQPRTRWFAGCNTFLDVACGAFMCMLALTMLAVIVTTEKKLIQLLQSWFAFVLFIMLGLFGLSSPLQVYRKTTRTVYAITSRRAFILRPKFWGGHVLRSFPPDLLDKAGCEEKSISNGFGNLILQRVAVRANNRVPLRPLGFFDIPDVQNVERILISMRDENLSSQP